MWLFNTHNRDHSWMWNGFFFPKHHTFLVLYGIDKQCNLSEKGSPRGHMWAQEFSGLRLRSNLRGTSVVRILDARLYALVSRYTNACFNAYCQCVSANASTLQARAHSLYVSVQKKVVSVLQRLPTMNLVILPGRRNAPKWDHHAKLHCPRRAFLVQGNP